MRIRVKFYWRDFWIGAYFDNEERKVVICLFPMFPIILDSKPQNKSLQEFFSTLLFASTLAEIFGIGVLVTGKIYSALLFFIVSLSILILMVLTTRYLGGNE